MKFKILLRFHQKTNIIPFNTKLLSNTYCTKNGIKISEKNVIKSRASNIAIPPVFLEDYIWQKMDKWHNKTAVVCAETGRSYSFSELYKTSYALSNFLRKKVPGIKQKDVIAIVLPNIPEYAIILLGVIQAGLIATTINPNYTADEISHQLKLIDAKFIFTVSTLWPQVQQAMQKIHVSLPVMVVKHEQTESIPNGTINFNEMLGEDHTVRFEVNRNVDDVAIIPFSSGTTGLPKGVELTHRNIVSNICQLDSPEFRHLKEAEGSFQEVLPLVLPIFHLYGMVIILLRGLSLGSKLITIPKFTPKLFVEVLANQSPTLAYLAPPLVLFLLNNNLIKPDSLKQLKTIVSSAAPLGAKDVQRLYEKAKHTIFLQLYGLTEASPVLFAQTSHLYNGIKIGGAGLVIPNTEFIIIDSKTNDRIGLSPNMSGEILVRGPQVMKGYYKNEKATHAMIDGNGWMSTGDVAHYDKDGHLFVTDRLKELIKVKGFQVAPAELEELLRSHPDVEDSAVVGIPHPTYGEVPKAFVVARSNSKIDVNKIQEFVASNVAEFKQLKGGVMVLNSIPKTASGKILRRELKKIQ